MSETESVFVCVCVCVMAEYFNKNKYSENGVFHLSCGNIQSTFSRFLKYGAQTRKRGSSVCAYSISLFTVSVCELHDFTRLTNINSDVYQREVLNQRKWFSQGPVLTSTNFR